MQWVLITLVVFESGRREICWSTGHRSTKSNSKNKFDVAWTALLNESNEGTSILQ